jgi:hypothetical protein
LAATTPLLHVDGQVGPPLEALVLDELDAVVLDELSEDELEELDEDDEPENELPPAPDDAAEFCTGAFELVQLEPATKQEATTGK